MERVFVTIIHNIPAIWNFGSHQLSLHIRSIRDIWMHITYSSANFPMMAILLLLLFHRCMSSWLKTLIDNSFFPLFNYFSPITVKHLWLSNVIQVSFNIIILSFAFVGLVLFGVNLGELFRLPYEDLPFDKSQQMNDAYNAFCGDMKRWILFYSCRDLGPFITWSDDMLSI